MGTPGPSPDQSSRARPRAITQPPTGPGYLELSRRPLAALVFVLPLLLVYEAGISMRLVADGANNSGPDAITLEAHRILGMLFETFGVLGVHVPAAMIVAVLLAWHVIRRDPMRMHPGVLGGMLAESVVWTIPLLVLAPLIGQLAAETGATIETSPASWWEGLTLALGAGIYEEFLFRLVGIAAIHAIMVDLLRLPRNIGLAGAVLGAAALFAMVHPLPDASWDPVAIRGYYLLAGTYFGIVYALRGFGVVVGVHAAYDVVALVLLGGLGSQVQA